MERQKRDFAQQARDAQQIIREILLRDWDPIGVAEVREAQDEYDSYVADVYRLLSRRASANELFEFLWWLETQHMGLVGDRQRTTKVATRLRELAEDGTLPGTLPTTPE